MSLWIKICGNTSLEDALLAARSGADAVGFVFASSPRQVTVKRVETIVAALPASLEKIGVFVGLSAEEIETTVRACGLTGVQLHFETDRDLAAKLRKSLGPELRILHVVHYTDALAENLGKLANDASIDSLLLDSRTANAVGGTGIAFDWKAAATSVGNAVSKKRIVVAGGLSPANVAEAIATLRPWGVDVVSGVEAEPGHKDPDKVRAFIAHARAAADSATTR